VHQAYKAILELLVPQEYRALKAQLEYRAKLEPLAYRATLEPQVLQAYRVR
jgi:hypothetical protein